VEYKGPTEPFGVGFVPGGPNELTELSVGNDRSRNGERIDFDFADGSLTVSGEPARIIGPHQELSARKWDQPEIQLS